jgi:hypothetical protein
MSHRLSVVILGFGAFERQALLSALRTSSAHAAVYSVVDTLDEARFVIVDTDDAQALQTLGAPGWLARAVCIGSSAPDAAGAWMMRPLDAAKTLQLLDAVVRRSSLSGDAAKGVPAAVSPAAAGPEPTAQDGERRRGSNNATRGGDRRA